MLNTNVGISFKSVLFPLSFIRFSFFKLSIKLLKKFHSFFGQRWLHFVFDSADVLMYASRSASTDITVARFFCAGSSRGHVKTRRGKRSKFFRRRWRASPQPRAAQVWQKYYALNCPYIRLQLTSFRYEFRILSVRELKTFKSIVYCEFNLTRRLHTLKGLLEFI